MIETWSVSQFTSFILVYHAILCSSRLILQQLRNILRELYCMYYTVLDPSSCQALVIHQKEIISLIKNTMRPVLFLSSFQKDYSLNNSISVLEILIPQAAFLCNALFCSNKNFLLNFFYKHKVAMTGSEWPRCTWMAKISEISTEQEKNACFF